VQFVNILDFMMVMPLGPDFAVALKIEKSHLGVVASSYTAAAAISGIVGAVFLDRFDRRKALLAALFGLALATASGGLARSLPELLAARIAAGLFGGPATALAISIVSDIIVPARRGRAMAIVMSAFSLASVVGVPTAFEVAKHLGWRAPFFSIGGLALLVCVCAAQLLPPMTAHLDRSIVHPPVGALVRWPVALIFLALFLASAAAFSVIPNISSYVQYNLGEPRDSLRVNYAVGGIMALIATRLGGVLADRIGSAWTGTAATCLVSIVVVLGFVFERSLVPLPVLFGGFMFAMSMRNVAVQSIASKVPAPAERARFGSLSSAVQHLSSSAGGFLSSLVLSEAADGRLIGMDATAKLSVALSIAFILPLFLLERSLARQN
jgi:predicted MFS family arabinose efflux permease